MVTDPSSQIPHPVRTFIHRWMTISGSRPGTVVGLFLLAWTIFTVIMTIAAVRVSGAVLAVFVVLTLTFAFLTIGEFASNASMAKVGGWLGLVTAALAWYTAMAGVTAATYKRSVFPTWPAS